MELTGEKIGGNKPWVARIAGTDPRFGLKREFVAGVVDYSRANRPRTRGVRTSWSLREPGLYEYNLPQSWGRTDRGFLEVTAAGEVRDVDAAAVAARLSDGRGRA